VVSETREEQRKVVTEFGSPQLIREFYGMPDAARDLAVKPRAVKPGLDETLTITMKAEEIDAVVLRKTKVKRP
jgi:hypothetical protein